MGQVACQTIPFGKGVCGDVAVRAETQIVPNVEARPGHIACDGATKSEIVVPILEMLGNEHVGYVPRLVGVIDVDCADLKGFDEVDKVWLERLAALLARSCDWPWPSG
jgi:L-methionine (R)-S-oxide reductase